MQTDEGSNTGELMGRYNEKEKEELDKLCRNLIEWLNNNGHPHMTIVLTTTHYELLEGIIGTTVHDYIRG